MSNNITEKLRAGFGGLVPPICDAAANEIDSLRSRVKELESALETVLRRNAHPIHIQGYKVQEFYDAIIEQALKGGGSDGH